MWFKITKSQVSESQKLAIHVSNGSWLSKNKTKKNSLLSDHDLDSLDVEDTKHIYKQSSLLVTEIISARNSLQLMSKIEFKKKCQPLLLSCVLRLIIPCRVHVNVILPGMSMKTAKVYS